MNASFMAFREHVVKTPAKRFAPISWIGYTPVKSLLARRPMKRIYILSVQARLRRGRIAAAQLVTKLRRQRASFAPRCERKLRYYGQHLRCRQPARVSVATVSAVVNNTAYVSPPLKARVEAAVKRLGYRPNLVARGLATQQSRTLGVIVPNIANPFWPEVVRGIEDEAHRRGYTLLLASGDDDPQKEARYLMMFVAKGVDGILLTKAPAPCRATCSRSSSRRARRSCR